MLHITFPWIDTPSSTDIKALILLFEECRSFSAHTWTGEAQSPVHSELRWKWMSTLPNTQPLLCGDSAWPSSWKDVDLILLVPTLEFPGMKEFSRAKNSFKKATRNLQALIKPNVQHRVSFVSNPGGFGGSCACRAAGARQVPRRERKDTSAKERVVSCRVRR